jgi:hypothetical protein
VDGGKITSGGGEVNAQEKIKALKIALIWMLDMHDKMMSKVNHGASFYDGDTIKAMNEAPIYANQILKEIDKK